MNKMISIFFFFFERKTNLPHTILILVVSKYKFFYYKHTIFVHNNLNLQIHLRKKDNKKKIS